MDEAEAAGIGIVDVEVCDIQPGGDEGVELDLSRSMQRLPTIEPCVDKENQTSVKREGGEGAQREKVRHKEVSSSRNSEMEETKTWHAKRGNTQRSNDPQSTDVGIALKGSALSTSSASTPDERLAEKLSRSASRDNNRHNWIMARARGKTEASAPAPSTRSVFSTPDERLAEKIRRGATSREQVGGDSRSVALPDISSTPSERPNAGLAGSGSSDEENDVSGKKCAGSSLPAKHRAEESGAAIPADQFPDTGKRKTSSGRRSGITPAVPLTRRDFTVEEHPHSTTPSPVFEAQVGAEETLDASSEHREEIRMGVTPVPPAAYSNAAQNENITNDILGDIITTARLVEEDSEERNMAEGQGTEYGSGGQDPQPVEGSVMVTIATAKPVSPLIRFVQDHCLLVTFLGLVFLGGIAGLSAYLATRNSGTPAPGPSYNGPLFYHSDQPTSYPSMSANPSISPVPSDMPTSSPSSAPTEPCNMPSLEWSSDVTTMLEGIVSDPSVLHDPSLPQAHALLWLTAEDKIFPRLCPLEDSARLAQRFGLALMHFALGGEGWRYFSSEGKVKFLEGINECDWAAVDCNSDTNMVTHIQLEDRNIRGTFPIEMFSMFSDLRVLNMANNRIAGSLPEEIANFTKLEFIYLSSNQLTGTLAPAVGSLTNLEELDLSRNAIGGTLSSAFFELGQLISLRLARNKISGDIPEGIGLSTNLKVFDLSRNNLTGLLSTKLSTLANLTSLRLNDNSFYGRLPSSMSKLVGIRELWLHRNNLSGELPETLSALAGLEHLALSYNFFNGSFPDIGELAALEVARFEHNYDLRGSIPASVAWLKNLKVMTIQKTGISNVNYCVCNLKVNKGGNLRRLVASCDEDRSCREENIPCFDCSNQDPPCPSISVPVDDNCEVPCGEPFPICEASDFDTDCSCCECEGPESAPSISLPSCYCPMPDSATRAERILGELACVSDAALLSQPSSPQAKAANWLINEDGFVLDEGRLLRERYAVALLYFATNGDEWLHCSAQESSLCGVGRFTGRERFLSNTSVCDWAGVECNWGGVDSLHLAGNGLQGMFPFSELFSTCQPFSEVSNVDLSSNELYGTLDSSLFNRPFLRTLLLNDNLLNGTISSGGWFTPMEVLRLDYNALSGSIPQEFDSFEKLKELRLDNNVLTNTLPASMSGLGSLEVLTIQNNNFNGSVPDSICDLTFENGGLLEDIWADCEGGIDAQIRCDCCTMCFL